MLVRVEHVGRDIAAISLGGLDSNIYLVKKQLLIDAGGGWHKEGLEDALRSLGTSLEKIKTIIQTHNHFDHVGGNWLFKNAKIAIGMEDAAALESKDAKSTYAVYFGAGVRKLRAADVKLADGDTFRVGNLRLEVIHTPGHTKGSVCVYEPASKTLFSGDTIFARSVGRTDLIGGSFREMEESLKKLARFRVEKILPGHGPIVAEGGSEHIRALLDGGGRRAAEERAAISV